MIKKLFKAAPFKAALIISAFAGGQLMAVTSASASETGLLKYAQESSIMKGATAKEGLILKPFKVASKRSRRRNRIIGGVIAAGVAAVLLNEAARSNRRNRHYYNDRYYDNRSYRSSRRYCRKLANRCDWGNRRACRKWNRRCY